MNKMINYECILQIPVSDIPQQNYSTHHFNIRTFFMRLGTVEKFFEKPKLFPLSTRTTTRDLGEVRKRLRHLFVCTSISRLTAASNGGKLNQILINEYQAKAGSLLRKNAAKLKSSRALQTERGPHLSFSHDQRWTDSHRDSHLRYLDRS